MEKEESILKKYHTEVTGLLTEMDKEEAIDFFNKYKFDKENIYIMSASENEMESLSDDEDIDAETLNEDNDVIENNEIEYSNDIVDYINGLDENTNIYVTFDEYNYNYVYTQMMKERIFLSDTSTRKKIFSDLRSSYLEYLKIPDNEKDSKYNCFDVLKQFTNSLEDFIDACNNDIIMNGILITYKELTNYYTKLEIKQYYKKHFENNKISTINDIIRTDLMNRHDNLFKEYYDRITVFEKLHSELLKKQNFYSNSQKQPICNNDYVKLVIINDAYLDCKVLINNETEDEYKENTILDIFEKNEQVELVEKFNTDKGFALRCYLLFIEFNTRNNYNISKSTLKKVYADKKVLQKINKYHFLDYVSND